MDNTRHRIGILSDTHGLLRPEVSDALQGCEMILHAGDINTQDVIDKLQEIAPVRVVRGNADKEWAEHLPGVLEVDLYGKKALMVHNKKFIPKNLAGIDIVIFGHSHKYQATEKEGVVYLNPGSCGPRKSHQEITLMMLYVDGDKVEWEKVEIAH